MSNFVRQGLGAVLTAAQISGAAAQEREFTPAEESFVDCAIDAMQSVSGLSLSHEGSARNDVDVYDNGIRVTSTIPALIPMKGIISMSAAWAWDQSAPPPVIFNGDGDLQTSYAVDQEYVQGISPNVVIIIPVTTAATVDAHNGQITVAFNWVNDNQNQDLAPYVLEQSRKLNEAMLSCGTPSLS